MESTVNGGLRRLLRLFWEIMCPYEIYWGTEEKKARTHCTRLVRFSHVPTMALTKATWQEAPPDSKWDE